MNRNLKLLLAIIYLVCLISLLFAVFNYLDFKNLSNYTYIRDNSQILISFKNNNLYFFVFAFFIFACIWILLLGFGSPIAILSGFLFGQWLGTFISLFAFTIGSSLLYLLANLYFSEFIIKNLSSKIAKYKNLFNKNEFLYYMIFRFSGGGGIPFAIQNILPVVFNMKLKNYIYSTFFGLIPIVFIINSLGAGINNVIYKNKSLSYIDIIKDPDIYLPLLLFVFVLTISMIVKKKFFKN